MVREQRQKREGQCAVTDLAGLCSVAVGVETDAVQVELLLAGSEAAGIAAAVRVAAID